MSSEIDSNKLGIIEFLSLLKDVNSQNNKILLQKFTNEQIENGCKILKDFAIFIKSLNSY